MNKFRMNIWRPVFFANLGMVLAVFSLIGCESLPIDGIIGTSIVPASEPNDPCNSEVQSFQEDAALYQPLVTDSDMQTAVKGILGSFAGKTQPGADMKDIILNVAQTSLDRTTQAYLTKLSNQAASQASIMQTINADASADSQKLDRTQQKITRLRSCRERQIARIDQDLKARRITPQTADEQYQNVQRLVDRDNQFIGKIMELSGKRVNTYAEAEHYITTGQEIAGGAKFVQRGANVRSGPSTTSSILGKISQGEQVKANQRVADGEWYAVTYQGQSAYIHSSLLDDRPPRKGSGSGVKKVVASQEKAEREQKELVELDRAIDRRRAGLEA